MDWFTSQNEEIIALSKQQTVIVERGHHFDDQLTPRSSFLIHMELHECIQSCPVATHRLPGFALSAGGERVETCQV